MLHRLQGMTTAGCRVLSSWWLKQLSQVTFPARHGFALLVLALSPLMFASPAVAQFTQQGPKLVGSGAIGLGHQARAVAVSADGNTAVLGGGTDNNSAGAAWVYTRSAGVWSQQGPKLVGTGAVGSAVQGISVSISADGNTVIVGGYGDNNWSGAAWIYTRSAGVWSQQGSKLVGSGAVGAQFQGSSVALSGDGNTAIVGGPGDNFYDTGATWIFTRSAGVWSQQGSRLVVTGAQYSPPHQGAHVALSGDGNTAIIGGPGDNNFSGAAWIFTRSSGVWSQQGSKLVGTGTVLAGANQGSSVALSGDGNTAIVGGPGDNRWSGAAWIYTRNAGAWSQQGSKLVGIGVVGQAAQGVSVALSGDGSTAIFGGSGDSNGVGAAWIYTRSAGVWNQLGPKLVGTGAVGQAYQGVSVTLSGDGSTAIFGGSGDNNGVGAAWVWTQPPAPLTVTTISPNSGPPEGGTRVTITGTGFVNGATVKIDGAPATSVTWVSSTSLTATTPAGSAAGTATGAKNVVVTNPDAQSGTLTNGFTYVASYFWATGISPDSGPVAGGTAVTITGVGFNTSATVTIDGTPATSVVRINTTTIIATTPPANGLVAGAKNVVITNNDNRSTALAGGFTYRSTVDEHCAGFSGLCLPQQPPAPGIRNSPTVLDLSSGSGPSMTRCLMDTLRQSLSGNLAYQRQSETGVTTITWNNQLIAFYPVAQNTTNYPDGPIHRNPSNTLDIATNCGTLVVAPAVLNLGELGAVLNNRGLFAQVSQDGMIVVQSNGNTYAVQPDFVVTPGTPGAPRLDAGPDGVFRFVDSGGYSQVLRPVSVGP